MSSNPIKLDERPSSPTEFQIPSRFASVMIYLTLKVKLVKEEWLFADAHTVVLGVRNLYPEKTPEPMDLKLDYGKDLSGKTLVVQSHISRFRNGSEGGTPSAVEYKLILEAGDELIQEFTATSDTNNPSDFNALIQFKLV